MWTAFFLLLFFLSTSVLGTTGVDDTIHSVGTCSNYPPYNYADDSGAEVGFDKDFFKLLTSKVPDLGLDRFDLSNRTSTPYFSQSQLQAQIIKGKLDMGICCTYITGARQNVYNFPQGYFYSPYVIVVRKTESSLSVQDLLASFSGIVPWFAVFVAELLAFIALIYTHMLWFSEAQTNDDFSSHYLRGIFQCVWFAITTVTTVGYGDKAPKKFLGRLSTMFWMVIGLVLYGVFMGSISSNLTVRKISNQVNGPADLSGKTLVTARNTVSETLSTKYGGRLVYVADKMSTFAALENGFQGATALIIDAPIAAYMLKGNFSQTLTTVAEPFSPARCGLLLAQNISTSVLSQLNFGIASVLNSAEYQTLIASLSDVPSTLVDEDSLYQAHTTRFGIIILCVIITMFLVGVAEKIIRMRRKALAKRESADLVSIVKKMVTEFVSIAKKYLKHDSIKVKEGKGMVVAEDSVETILARRIETCLALLDGVEDSGGGEEEEEVIERLSETGVSQLKDLEDRVVATLTEIDEKRMQAIEDKILSRLRQDQDTWNIHATQSLLMQNGDLALC